MSDQYPNGYPVIADWAEYAGGKLPDLCARDGGGEWFAALTAPLGPIDDQNALIYAAVVEIADANGAMLDLLGDFVNEPRGGLSGDEYRRLIAARRVARAGGVGIRRVWQAWQVLTAPSVPEIVEPGPASLYLRARIDWTPTQIWLRRAASVMRDVVGAGVDTEATLYRGNTAIFDETPGFDLRTWAYQLPILGAS